MVYPCNNILIDSFFFNIILGALLQQIIKEATSNIVEGPNLRVIVRTGTPENVAALLAACVAPPPRLPDPGAALLFELHERLPQPHQKNKKAVSEKTLFGLKVSNV